MPRKPKLPNPILRIEGLSGADPAPKLIIDDFTGEVIPSAVAQPKRKPVVLPQDARDAENRARASGAGRLLQRLGMLADPKTPELRLAHNQRKITANGQEYVITVTHTDRKPFPRRI